MDKGKAVEIKDLDELEFAIFCVENIVLLQKKYARIVERFAGQAGITLSGALDFFYHSTLYQLVRDGISDMHCMSGAYLAEDLREDYSKFLVH